MRGLVPLGLAVHREEVRQGGHVRLEEEQGRGRPAGVPDGPAYEDAGGDEGEEEAHATDDDDAEVDLPDERIRRRADLRLRDREHNNLVP